MSQRTRVSLPPETQTSTRSSRERRENFRIPSVTCRRKKTKKHSGQKALWWLGSSTAACAFRHRLHFTLSPRHHREDLDRLPVLDPLVLREQPLSLHHQDRGRPKPRRLENV